MGRPRGELRPLTKECVKCGETRPMRQFENPDDVHQYRKVCSTCRAKTQARTAERKAKSKAASDRAWEKHKQAAIRFNERLIHRLTRNNRTRIRQLEAEQAQRHTSRGQRALQQRYAIQERYARALQTIVNAITNNQPVPDLEDLV